MASLRYLTLPLPKALRGALWMIAWALAINGAMSLAKMLTPGISNSVLIFMRNIFGLMAFTPVFLFRRHNIWKTQQPIRQVLNACFITAAMGCTYYGYRHLPLAFATSIGFSGPLMTTLLSVLLLSEKITLKHWGIITFGYAGVVLALQPLNVTFHYAIFVIIGANFLASLAIINRKFLLKTDEPLTILLYGSLGGIVLSSLVVIFYWHPLTRHDVLLLCGIGALGALSQFCYISALSQESPSFVTPFEYTRLIIALPVGFFMFAEVPRWWMALGSLVIIVSTYMLTHLQLEKEQEKNVRKN